MIYDFSPLDKWFLENKRTLPWRDSPTPYSVWVSEVMLQQTRAEVVFSYFERWMQKFPSINSLAEAEESEVVKCWEGLGYYSRARRLHKGAKEIVERFKGEVPAREEELLSIKGIGPYTAGAILSFAYKKRAPCVDGNVLRVMARLFGIEEEITAPSTQKTIRNLLQTHLPEKNAYITSEALIELGALVCKKSPECRGCPLQKGCKAFLQGKELRLPNKKAREESIFLYRVVALIERDGKFLIRKVPQGEVMEGLYEFPYLEMEKKHSCKERVELLQNHFSSPSWIPYKEQKHTFTKYKVTLFPYRTFTNSVHFDKTHCFVPLEKLNQYPFSSGHRRVLNQLLGP